MFKEFKGDMEMEEFKCPDCGRTFTSKGGLRCHMTRSRKKGYCIRLKQHVQYSEDTMEWLEKRSDENLLYMVKKRYNISRFGKNRLRELNAA